MNDVTFGHNGRDAETWRLHRAATAMGVAIPGRSLMSMNFACFINMIELELVLGPFFQDPPDPTHCATEHDPARSNPISGWSVSYST